jgi:hypothetical protein
MRNTALIATVVATILSTGSATAQTENKAAEAELIPAPRVDCTIDKATLCKADGCSAADSLGDLPLPACVLVDQANDIIATVAPSGLPHVSRIGSQATSSNNTVVVQGVDGPTGWMMHGSPDDPTTSFVVSSNHTVLVGFGTCKPVE